MQLHVLWRGDYGLWVRSSVDRKEPVIELAKLAVSRMK